MRLAALLVGILLATDADGGEKQQCCKSDVASPGKAIATDQPPCLVVPGCAVCGDCDFEKCDAVVLPCPPECGSCCQASAQVVEPKCDLQAQAERLDHLLAAAEHLDAAGMPAEADGIRRRMDAEIHALVEQIKQLDVAAKSNGNAVQASFKDRTTYEQQVVVRVQMLEVDHAKIRSLGFDFAEASNDLATRGEMPRLLQAMHRKGLAKVLAEQWVMAKNGEPASFIAGGEVPIPTGNGDTVEYRKTGTEIDMLANILDDGRIRLQLRPRVTDLIRAQRPSVNSLPSFRTREVASDTILEDGQTVLLASWSDSTTADATSESSSHANEKAIYVLVRAQESEPIDPRKR